MGDVNNPPAFPQSKPIYMAQDNGDGIMQPTIVGSGVIGGMSLRDYFAAASLPSCISAAMDGARRVAIEEDRLEHIGTTMDRAAAWAFRAADAMLKARES